MSSPKRNHQAQLAALAITLMFSAAAVWGPSAAKSPRSHAPMGGVPARDGPADQGAVMARQDGDVALGQAVFRFETFGNEGFWTDAVRLPAGIAAAKVTPMQALELGLQVDVDAIDPATQAALAAQLRADPSAARRRSSTIPP